MAASQRLCEHITDDLLLTAGRGDLIAFADLYDQTVTAVYRLLRGVLGDSARAEPATERVYLQVWRMAPSHDPDRQSAYSVLMLTARRELAQSVYLELSDSA